MQEIYLLENKDKIFADVASDAGSKRHNAQIANQKNINLTNQPKNTQANISVDN